MKLKRVMAVVNTLLLRGLGSGIAVVFTMLISRYLPTVSASQFFLYFNIITIAAVCFRWGLDEVIIRRIAKLQSCDLKMVSRQLMAVSHRRVAYISIACLALFVPCFYLFPTLLSGSIELKGVLLSFASAGFIALAACSARVIQGVGSTNLATFLLNIAIPGLSLVSLLILMVVKEPTAYDLLVVYVFVSFAIYGVTVFRTYGDPIKLLRTNKEFDWENSYRRSANKLGVVVLAQQAVGWTALLIIPYAYGPEVYKGFVVVQKVATLISLIMLAVNFTFSRRFASLYADEKFAELRRMVVYSSAAIIVSSIGVTAFLVMIRHWLFAYAELDADLTGLLIVLLTGQVFFSMSALFAVVLSMAHDDNYLLISQAAVNGVGALALIGFCQFFSVETTSYVIVVTYFVLAIGLGFRVNCLTSK